MQLRSSTTQIPDGLLAAMTLLSEKPHQGVPSRNLAPHQGIDERNSTAALGLRASEHLNRIWPRYTGKERDTESGNDYFGARYYNSNTGRWLNPDWSAAAVPVPYGSLGNPQTLDLYAYVVNNPLTGVDADGHFTGDHAFSDYFATEYQESMNQAYQMDVAVANAQRNGYYQAHPPPIDTSIDPLVDDVVISDWPTGAGGFHHTGIAVSNYDSGNTVDIYNTFGFSTKDPAYPKWLRLFTFAKGGMENDIGHHTNKNLEVARHSYIDIQITDTQALAIRNAINTRTTHPGRYNLILRSCGGAVESFLHAGGISGVPHSEIFIPAILHEILLHR